MGKNDFGRWIEEHMRRSKRTQADLVRATGFGSGTISRWITGDRVPEPEKLAILADALDASVEEAFRVLGWLDTPTALTPAQADLIETIRRRNISDQTARTLLATLNAMEPRD